MVDFLPADCPVEWLTAAPLWPEALKDPNQRRFQQPALLRFASDQFMDQIQSVLKTAPATLQGLVARSETWEQERVGWVAANELPNEKPLRLYQPAHNRFYLVAATLCCHKPGLPDRTIQVQRQEKAGFLLRRLVKGVEYGWVTGGARTGWFPVAQPRTALPDEERLPLFPLNYCDGERKRRVLVGFVPVASRETYQAGADLSPVVTPGATPGEPDPRVDRFETRVETALALLNQSAGNSVSPTQAQEISAFIYLDLAELLNEQLTDVWGWVVNNANATDLINAHENAQRVALYQKLNEVIWPGLSETWAAGLRRTWIDRFILTDVDAAHSDHWYIDLRGASVSAIKTAFVAAVATYPLPQLTDPPSVPKIDPDLKELYVLRCVYDRPMCKELHPAVVSEQTAPFLLASFFEPEAPVRELRIVMPANTSIAGLRKFKKGVSFVVSDQLRNQMERVKGLKLKDLDDASIPAAPGYTLGKICSFSIPIITLCALILLFIIVQLLNIIFWWIPLLKICFPIKRR